MAVSLTEALAVVAPRVSRDTWVPALNAAFTKFEFNTNKRKAAALGQFLAEAGAAFLTLTEGLSYTHADHLHDVFPRAFPTGASAEPYLRNPEKLANRVYANRIGNGDEASGDGWRFCGRGLIQLTGRNNYTRFGKSIDKSADDASAYLLTPEGAAMSGCWFLSSKGCLPFADAWDIDGVTRHVNPAMRGGEERQHFSDAMLKQLDS